MKSAFSFDLQRFALGQTALTLLDWAKRLDPNGKVDKVVEILSVQNEMLDDMLWLEGNLPTGHKTTIRTGLPNVAWRQLYQGVQPSKSTTKQVTDTCGMLEAYSEIDVELAKLNGNTPEFRLSEDKPFLEAINIEQGRTAIYGDVETNPEKFVGLAPRYNTVNPATAATAANVIDAGGTGSDNTSIWLVVWGDNTVHGIFPKGSKAGIEHEDLGQQTAIDPGNNGYFQVYRGHYIWKCGLVVRDWRYVVRICNIDVSDLNTAGDNTGDVSANLMKHMVWAYNKIPNIRAGKAAWYANKEVKSALDVKALGKANLMLTYERLQDGVPLTSFMGVPIRRCDVILNTEARLT